VHAAYNPNQCDKLCVKIISKVTANPEETRNELDIMQSVRFPGVVGALAAEDDDDNTYIFMKIYNDGDLYDYVFNAQLLLEERTVAVIMHQLINAVRQLHAMGIWHRDIKLENVLIENPDRVNPRVVLSDFGYGCLVGPNKTRTKFLGTVSYIAPEMLLKQPYTGAVDIWALGVVMFMLLSCGSPWDSIDVDIIEPRIINHQITYDPYIWDDISDEAKDLVAALMAPKPADRIALVSALDHPFFQIHYPERPRP
jgi:serine/threonine protein kinase